MRPFSLLIKPAGADCNLRCAYCFYLKKRSLYPDSSTPRMSLETLETLLAGYFQTPQPQYAFGWQGGEPTLMGMDFFKKVVDLQIKHAPFGASVANHLQTNALGVDDELAELLARFNFLVGVSLDGPAALHNRFRRSAKGGGSYHLVMKGIATLGRHKVKTNVLTLVNSGNVGQAKRIHDYLAEQGLLHQQYIPCVEFDEHGRPAPHALRPEQWGKFLCSLFDHWFSHGAGRVSVRYFDSLVYFLATGQYNLCQMDKRCGQYFLVEHNGDVYPCDFFAEPALKLGNIHHDDWERILASPIGRGFASFKSQWNKDCGLCPYLALCAADCLKHRLTWGNKTPSQKSWLCQGYQIFFEHALPRLRQLAGAISGQAQAGPSAAVKQSTSIKVGRNQPCPCGSGLKFKKCCGREQAAANKGGRRLIGPMNIRPAEVLPDRAD